MSFNPFSELDPPIESSLESSISIQMHPPPNTQKLASLVRSDVYIRTYS